MEHREDKGFESLLEEELTSGELRELLERLNVREFGGSENATVGSVVEATNADPATVGRLLAEIRKEDFEERFGLRLDRTEERIEKLERRSHQREPHAVMRTPKFQPFSPAQLAVSEAIAKQKRTKKWFGILAIVFLGLILFAIKASGIPDQQSSHPFSIDTVNGGKIVGYPDGRISVREKDGSTRQATEEEKVKLSQFFELR